jgi:D-threonate/D-erythronate kinase
MQPPRKIIVIADDLSGAAELAGLAFSHGLSAEVQRQFEPSTDAQLIALDTDSRHLSSTAAADRVRQITKQVINSHPAWLFKKVDSVLRGNVRAEIEAVLSATGLERAVLVPANPSRGRTIVQGQYLIDGVPLRETHFAHDPEHPRSSSDVQSILGSASSSRDQVFIPNVATQPQLQQLAAHCDAHTLASGAADFFASMLQERCGPQRNRADSALLNPPALLLCGSRAAWPIRVDQCRSAGIPIVTIDEPITRFPPSGALLLGIGDSQIKTDSSTALANLACTAADLMSRAPRNTLLAEGGATAAAIAQQMSWTRFTLAGVAPAGVGVLRPLPAHHPEASARDPLFLIKPGSYPWPAGIWDAFCRLNRA